MDGTCKEHLDSGKGGPHGAPEVSLSDKLDIISNCQDHISVDLNDHS